MGKDISRRTFLKGSLAGAAAVTLAGLGVGGSIAKAEGKYTPGTYSASAKGIASDVKVTMTFDADAITDVQIDVSGETAGIGAEIGGQMAEAIMSAQSLDIDTVTGATVTSDAIRTAAAACISQASGTTVELSVQEEAAPSDWLGQAPGDRRQRHHRDA